MFNLVEQQGSINLSERVATTAALSAYFVAGYFSVQLIPTAAPIRVPMIGLDRTIPFTPGWAWAYVWAIPAAAAPAFVVRSRVLFRSTAVAYLLAITISLAIFIALPASAVALRPSSTILDLTDPSQWLVANLYAIDPPGNLFPSLHLSMTALSAWAVWKADRRFGRVAFLGVVLVAASTCAVKQHFIADVLGGLALAAFLGALTIDRCNPERGESTQSRISGGVAFYLIFTLLFYAVIIAAYSAGLRISRCPDITGACLVSRMGAPLPV